MQRASDIIPRVLHKRGLRTHATASHVVFLADQWFEEHLPLLKDDLSVHSLKDGVLMVHCTHSIAQQECMAVSEQLLEYLRNTLDACEIDAIRPIRAT